MSSFRFGKVAAAIAMAGLVCLGCSSDSGDASSSPTATPDTTTTAEPKITPATSLDDMVKQTNDSGALNAGVDLQYEKGNANFSADVDPTPKEAVITFVPDGTWSAYFASDSSNVFTGTYQATPADDDALEIEIIHDGKSADGTDNVVTLKKDGKFVEVSKVAAGSASGKYTITKPEESSS